MTQSAPAARSPTTYPPTLCSRSSGATLAFGQVRALKGVTMHAAPRRGHRHRRRQRRREVDAGPLLSRRAHARLRHHRLRRAARALPLAAGRARRRHRDGAPEPRPGRGPHRVAEPVPQPRARPRVRARSRCSTAAAMRRKAKEMVSSAGGQRARRQITGAPPVGRPAPGRIHLPGSRFQLQARHHGRTDRGTGRAGDRPRRGAHPPAARRGPRRPADQPQLRPGPASLGCSLGHARRATASPDGAPPRRTATRSSR